MSLAPSPLQDVTALLGRRNLTKIPKDQQKILDGTDSWAVDLRHQPHGLVQIPGHVLKTVQEAYRARETGDQYDREDSTANRSEQHSTADPKCDVAPESSPAPEPTGSARQHSRPPKSSAPQSSPTRARVPTSSPVSERLPSWSPSPDRSARRQPIVGSSMVCETPAAAPMAPPPRPTPLPQAAPMFSFPSSDNEEEDLETEFPQAHSLPDAPVNREAAHLPLVRPPPTIPSSFTDNTPPCAQPQQGILPSSMSPWPVIPVTEQQLPRVPPQDAAGQERRTRRMKPIKFSGTTPVPPRSVNVSASFTGRMPFTKIVDSIESSQPDSSESIVPQSLPQGTTGLRAEPVEIGIEDNMLVDDENVDDENVDYEIEYDDIEDEEDHSDDYRELHMSQVVSTAEPSTQLPGTASITISEDSSMDPFDAFAAAYPDYMPKYAGSLSHFVMACVSLQFLQREKLLAELLYDDFIRTYSSGYLPYCRRTGPSQEQLSSIEWFNSSLTEILFQRRIVTRDSLSVILASYPVQVARARTIVKGDMDDDVTGEVGKRAKQKSWSSTSTPEARLPTVNVASTPVMKRPTTADGAMDIDEPSPNPSIIGSARSAVSQSRARFSQPPAPPSPEIPAPHSPDVAASLSPKMPVPASEQQAPPSPEIPGPRSQSPAIGSPEMPESLSQVPAPSSPEIPVPDSQPPAPASPEMPVSLSQPPAPPSPEIPVPDSQPPAPVSPEMPVSRSQPPAPPSPQMPAPPSPQLGTQSMVQATAPPAPTPTPSARGRPSSSYYFDRARSDRRSSSVRTPEEEEARRRRLKKFMKRKRESDLSTSAASSRRGSLSRAE